jgi:predicted phosphoribosyltransferase
MIMFTDRHDAGRQLAESLTALADDTTLVLALPRGGVVVGYEVAKRLGAELDVLVVRKLGAPHNPDYGFGAIGPGGVRVLDNRAVRMLGLSDDDIEEVTERETAELQRRLKRYRGEKSLPQIEGRSVIVVDDGIATGGTARAALQTVRAQNPGQLILAVPVAPPDTAEKLHSEVDKLVCLQTPPAFMAVGQWYQHFDQTSDEEVIQLLQKSQINS